jgi:hypothetical protein
MFYKDILSKFFAFVNSRFNDIILVVIVILLTLLSFALGFIMAKYQDKEPIKIEQKFTYARTYTTAHSFIS